jgi:hypothetical protein
MSEWIGKHIEIMCSNGDKEKEKLIKKILIKGLQKKLEKDQADELRRNNKKS